MYEYDNLEKILKEKGLKQSDIIKGAGISPGTLNSWKKGEYIPKEQTRKAIAYFLGISQTLLDTGKDEPKKSTDGDIWYFDNETAKLAEEIQKDPQRKLLFEAARNVSPENIELAINMFKQFQESNKNDGG